MTNSSQAHRKYLDSILRQLPETNGAVLECGSGLSTLLIGIRCKQAGREVWALEHSPQWADRLQRTRNRFSADSVYICRTSLIRYPKYDWYDKSMIPIDLRFGLIICDGPPSSTRGGRYGLLPLMSEQMVPGCRVFLDDAARPQEQEILVAWADEFRLHGTLSGQQKSFAVAIKPVAAAGVQG